MLLNPYRFAGGGGGTDPDFASVTLLLHMDSFSGDALIDVKGHTVTRIPASAITADTTIKKFGAASIKYPAATNYVTVAASADWVMTGDFTIEAWAYWDTNSLAMAIFNFAGTWNVGRDSSARLYFYNGAMRIQTGSVSLDAWHHIALTRSGSTITLWLDGASLGTYTNSGTVGSNALWYIGAFDPAADGMRGYIDDFRVTKGVCRYTATFTPPSSAFPDS